MGNNTGKRMYAADLSVGQTLRRARTASFGTHLVENDPLVIEKITTTRLVLSTHYGKEVRVILRDGEVTNKYEGDKHGYAALYTPDDDQLARMRATAEAGNLKSIARGLANDWHHNPSDREKAIAARDAIDKWLEATKEDDQ
jgi:hypothetical protein